MLSLTLRTLQSSRPPRSYGRQSSRPSWTPPRPPHKGRHGHPIHVDRRGYQRIMNIEIKKINKAIKDIIVIIDTTVIKGPLYPRS
jgi:hypothetical protein